MRKLIVSLVASLFLGLIAGPAYAANPKGTKYVDKSRSREITGAVCAVQWGKNGQQTYLAGKWVKKKSSSFIAYAQLAANDNSTAKKKKGKTKAKYLKSAAAWTNAANYYQDKCNKINALKVNLAGTEGIAQVTSTSMSALRAFKNSSDPNIRALAASDGINIVGLDANSRFVAMFPNIAELIAARKAEMGNCMGCMVSIPKVNGIISGPGESVYLSFTQRFDPNQFGTNSYNMNSASSCNLFVVSPASTSLDCVDNELESNGNWTNSNVGNTPVQFDDAGAVYYKGQFRRAGTDYSNPGYSAIRKKVNGAIRDVVWGTNISISDFLVLPTGALIVSGSTRRANNSSEQWIRLYPADGGDMSDLAGNAYWGGILRLFPDGNVYFSNTQNGLNKFITTSMSVDPQEFRSSMGCCGSQYFARLDLGTIDGADDYIVVANGANQGGSIRFLFPNDSTVATGLTQIQVIEGAGNYVLASGKNVVTNGQASTTTYLTNAVSVDGTITPIPSLNGIEVYTSAYAGNNTVVINGARRNGTIVTGTISLDPGSFGTFTVGESDAGRVDDIQLYGQLN